MITIALLGHAAHNDNLGVGALTVSEVRILREIAERNGIAVRYLLIDSGGARPACVTGDDLIERPVRPLRRPWELVRVLRESDLVIDISGGDSFAGIYGRRRLFIVFLQKFLAHLLGRPVVMAPQTVGPFRGRISRSLARATLKRTTLLATRDAKSTAFIRDLGLKREVIEASDVALRLPYEPPGDRPPGPVRVGVNVSGLLMKEGRQSDNAFGLTTDYPKLIHSLIRDFLNRDEACEIHLVGHVIAWDGHGQEDDCQAARMLAAEFPSAKIAPSFVTPSEAKTYIAGLDFFTGARMHACIAAFSSGVPVVPMAYSRKFAGLFGSLGYDHTVDCTSEDEETILARIRTAFDNRADLTAEGQTSLAQGLENWPSMNANSKL